MASLGEPKNTIAILNKYNFVFQKKFGQNFLIDPRVLEKIVLAAGIEKDDLVIEIGPGIGTMTQYLCESARHVVAVEIDRNLIPILTGDTLKDYSNVTVINEDILKLDINRIIKEQNGGRPARVVANLPYYITTPIIMGLFEAHVPLLNVTVMVQKEVANRMQAEPGSKDYGALSLAVQYYAEPYIMYKEPPVDTKDEKFMFSIIRASFNQRRKTLVNALANGVGELVSKEAVTDALGRMGQPATVRGEMFTLADFALLSNILQENK